MVKGHLGRSRGDKEGDVVCEPKVVVVVTARCRSDRIGRVLVESAVFRRRGVPSRLFDRRSVAKRQMDEDNGTQKGWMVDRRGTTREWAIRR